MSSKYWEKLDEHNDQKFERDIRNKIEYFSNLISIEQDKNKKLEYIKSVISLYDDLRINCLDYTERDEKEKQKYIKEIDDIVNYRFEKKRNDVMYNELMKNAKNEKENESWEDFEREESLKDDREEEER